MQWFWPPTSKLRYSRKESHIFWSDDQDVRHFSWWKGVQKGDDSYRKLGEKHTPQHPINDAFPGLQIISFCESSTTWSMFNAHLVCPSHRWSPRWGHDNLPRTSIGDVSFIFPVPPQANQLQAPFHPISSMKSPPNTPQQWLPQNLATAFSKSRTQISWQIKQSGPLLVIEVGL